jgi:hypothetical protein
MCLGRLFGNGDAATDNHSAKRNHENDQNHHGEVLTSEKGGDVREKSSGSDTSQHCVSLST